MAGAASRQSCDSSPSSGCISGSDLLPSLLSRLLSAIACQGVEAQDREDVLQDVLLAYILKRDSILNPESWLFAAVFKQCQQRRRGLARRRVFVEQAAAAPVESGADPSTTLDLYLDFAVLLRRLRPREQAAVVLRHRAGCTASEAATRLGVSLASCEKLLARAQHRMREHSLAAGLRS